MRQLLRRLAHWVFRARHDDALAEEMECHRALLQANLEADGMSPRDAAAESRRVMGNIRLSHEDAREVWIGAWIDRLSRDIRYGWRGLRREKTFSLAAILTFALGVTTTTTVFSVVDAELWKPLAFPSPDELVMVSTTGSEPGARIDILTGAELAEWREGATLFADLASVGGRRRLILRAPNAESVIVAEVTSNYLAMLGRSAVVGRIFTGESEDGTREAVLTARGWQRLFDSDAAVIGRQVRLDEAPATIVGVVRADDSIGTDPDFFVPIDGRARPLRNGTVQTFFGAIGRMKPGVTPAMAREQMQGVVDRMASDRPERWRGHAVDVEDLRSFYTGSNWRPLYFCLGAALVVLLLSAVNIASLLLGRAVRRSREFALRGALGGGRAAIARQLLVEGALIALPAGGLGLLVSVWAVRWIGTQLPGDVLLRGSDIPVDFRVAAFTFGITLATTVLCVLMPMMVARRVDLARVIGPGGRTGRTSGEGKARAVLLVVQMALTVTLLSGAGIFLKSFVALTQVPLGFDPADALAVRTVLSGPRYESDGPVRDYADGLLRRIETMPGVMTAAIGSSSPLGSGPIVFFTDPLQPVTEGERPPSAIIRAVTPGYFRTMGIPVVRGQVFSDADTAGSPRVALVNEHLVDQVFGGASPVGRTIELQPSTYRRWGEQQAGAWQIVGVVANAKEIGINEVGFSDIYVPFAQLPAPGFDLVVRTQPDAAGLADAFRREAAEVDPSMPILSITPFADRVAGAMETERLNLLLISTFAIAAVLLAGVGIYGAMAYAVQTRTREFGVRLALGAQPSRLSAGALLEAGRLAALGGGVGLAITLSIARLIGDAWYLVPGEHNGLVYGVSLMDPLVHALAFGGLVAVAMAAGLVPARRAARIDPVHALRAD